MSGEKFSNMKFFRYNWEKSNSLRNIYRKIYGDDYPEETDHNSFVTMTDLKNIVKYLEIKPGDTFIDLGCGIGGPGLWIAHETDANYVGIDLSERAIEIAYQRIKDFKFKNKVNFQAANMCATNFPDNYFDAAISIDTLLFVPDKLAAVREVARILRSDSLFVFTTWEKKRPSKSNDIRPMLQDVGFEVRIYEETPNWERRQHDFYQSVLDSKEILIKEMGKEGSYSWIKEAEKTIDVLKYMRRVLVVAKIN